MNSNRTNHTQRARRRDDAPRAAAANRQAAYERHHASRRAAHSSTHKTTAPARQSKHAAASKSRSKSAGAATSLPRLPLMIAALVAVAVIAGFATTTFLNKETPHSESAKSATAAYVSPYDFSGLSNQNGRMTYSENGVQKSQLGVDVSEHQGTIDWDAVAHDDIQFAMLRVGNRGTTEGGLFEDSSFDSNLANAQAAGLQVGAYFYSQATSVAEAEDEADFVVGILDGRKLDLPIVFDHEQDTTTNARGNNVDRETLTAAARAFCQRIENAGYRSMVYGNKIDIARLNLSELGNRPVWFAEYNAAQPSGQFDFALWQYTNAGSVNGISTPVDLNLRFTDAL